MGPYFKFDRWSYWEKLYSANRHSRILINCTPKLLLVHLVVSVYQVWMVKKDLLRMKIDALPSTFLLMEWQIQWLTSLPCKIAENHIQVIKHSGHFYHLNPDLVCDMNAILLCPVCAKNPMTKDQESIAAGYDYGWLGQLMPLNDTTWNACVPVWLYNINLQIWAKHSPNNSIAFTINGPVKCLKVLPWGHIPWTTRWVA